MNHQINNVDSYFIGTTVCNMIVKSFHWTCRVKVNCVIYKTHNCMIIPQCFSHKLSDLPCIVVTSFVAVWSSLVIVTPIGEREFEVVRGNTV